MPLDETSIAGYVALTGEPVNVAGRLPPARRARPSDQPLLRREVGLPHEVDAGRAHARPPGRRDRRRPAHQQEARPEAVLQPAVAGRRAGDPFTSVDEELVELARQPGRGGLRERRADRSDIRKLFDDFVHAAVTAIEQRDPTTSGHSERVADAHRGPGREGRRGVHGGPFAGLRFTRDQLQEMRYAALLHDFGKVAVQEKSCGKGKKLYASADDRDPAALRLHPQGHRGRAPAGPARGAASPAAPRRPRSRRSTPSTSGGATRPSACSQAVLQANEPTVVEEESFRALMNLPGAPLRDLRGRGRLPGGGLGQGPS